MVSGTFRSLLRRVHLAVAFVFGGMFALSGLTGCALAWMHELDVALNPALFHAAPARGPLASGEIGRIVDRLAADPAYGRPSQLTLPERGGEVAIA
ncbi:MAG: PepSY domain-containing protein, partial [Massilia sp.]|nr:PepSY domain-containing protein [Massilia sp.]